MKINPLLESDFYKQVHWNQYPEGTTKIVSYWTPRGTRIDAWKEYIVFGIQGFIKEFLIETFNENFFNRSKHLVIKEYRRIMDYTLPGKNLYGIERVAALWDLGYLPLEIKALPEGTKCPVGCPMLEISNTHPDFFWLTNAVESVMSCELWHAMLSANVGYHYRQIVNKYYDLTCENDIPRRKALGDFAMRGQESKRSAYKSSAAWLLSFVNTATIPAIPYLEQYYNCDCTKEEVGFGSPSTEHSVMCSNFAVDGDEITMIRRLLTEIYPETTFSAVLDSYDYWNIVDNIIPQVIPELKVHKGKMLLRGDSGDPVEVVIQTCLHLFETVGYSVNSKGFKVLPPWIGVIYGDSITMNRLEKIGQECLKHKIALSNIALGVGSFSMQCFEEEDGKLNPYTRDSANFCVKATYCEVKGKSYPIFKSPKEMSFKKSHKGCVLVIRDSDGKLKPNDGHDFRDTYGVLNQMTPVFKDGKMIKEQSLKEIRNRLHEGDF